MSTQVFIENLLRQEGIIDPLKTTNIARLILERLAIEQTEKVRDFTKVISDTTGTVQNELNALLATNIEKINGGGILDRTTPLLEEGFKFHRSVASQSREVVIVEDHPCLRTVVINNFWHQKHTDGKIDKNGNTVEAPKLVEGIGIIRRGNVNAFENYAALEEKYKLAFPYVTYLMWFYQGATAYDGILGKLHVAVSNKPIQSLGDEVCWLPLPNIDANNAVCMGDWKGDWHKGATLAERVKSTITAFWNSQFNYMLNDSMTISDLGDPRLKSFRTWQEHSRDDVLFPLSVKWTGAKSLVEMLKGIVGNGKESIVATPVTQLISSVALNIFKPVQYKAPEPPPPPKPPEPIKPLFKPFDEFMRIDEDRHDEEERRRREEEKEYYRRREEEDRGMFGWRDEF